MCSKDPLGSQGPKGLPILKRRTGMFVKAEEKPYPDDSPFPETLVENSFSFM